LDKDEALTIQREIIASCKGLTQAAVKLVLPNVGDSLSHGYQLHVKSELLKENVACLKTIAGKHNLSMNESRKDLVIIYRPCFIGYSSRELL